MLGPVTGNGGTVDTGADMPQYFPMTFVKARVSCEIPAQTNADLPHTFNRMSELYVQGYQGMAKSHAVVLVME